MDRARLATLLAPYLAPAESAPLLDALSAYLDLLLRWNARINLTAVRSPEEIVTRHFGESLFAARHLLAPGEEIAAIDVGAGAGFPGLPLKLWDPSLRLTLVESQNKKATFLKEVLRTLALRDVEVFTGRAETLARQANLVTLRAVERFESVLPVAARLVAPGGRLALLIGSAQAPLAAQLLPNFRFPQPICLPGAANRVIFTGENQRS